MSRPLVLASGSPRRAELLTAVGIPFEIVDPGGDGPSGEVGAEARVLDHARHKVQVVADRHPDRWVLAADTLVVVDGECLPQPTDRADAARMIGLLSGREHSVWTGVAVRGPRGVKGERADRTRIRFRAIEEEEVELYLDGEEWLGKAGAYGIQGAARSWATWWEGSLETVIGLDVAYATTLLRSIGWDGEAATRSERRLP